MNEWVHIVPINDLQEHNTDNHICDCNPELDHENELVIHSAFDGRDLVELAENGDKIE